MEEKDSHAEKVDEGEVTRNINRKKPDVLQTYKCPLFDTFQVSMIFLVARFFLWTGWRYFFLTKSIDIALTLFLVSMAGIVAPRQI